MTPPKEINVIDKHNGFTAITKSPRYEKIVTETGVFKEWRKARQECGTLWRPGNLLKNTIGVLQEYDENSFFQLNNNVTKAVYKVKGYPNRIAVWFDNETGERIA